MTRPIAALLCTGALVGSGFALAADQAGDVAGPTSATTRVCIATSRVDGFAPVGFDGVNLRVGREVFHMEFSHSCPEITDSTQIRLQSKTGGMHICNPLDAHVLAIGRFSSARTCHVREMKRLSQVERDALPKAERP